MAIIRDFATSLRAWARKDSSFTRYFPSKASRNLRYVLSQNIPEPGGALSDCGLLRDVAVLPMLDAIFFFF